MVVFDMISGEWVELVMVGAKGLMDGDETPKYGRFDLKDRSLKMHQNRYMQRYWD